MNYRTIAASTALLCVLAPGAVVSAQDMEPRAYSNAPVGLNFLIAGYGFAEGGVAFDPSVPLTNAHVRASGAFLAYARSFGIGGMSGKADVVLPYAWVSGHADFQGVPRDRTASGPGDPRLHVSVNFYGAPPLTLEQFAAYEQNLIIGASLLVTAPLGQYDADKLLNVGTNRWSVRPELGASKALGPLLLEAAANATFFTDNDDFFGGKQRQEDPIYSLQGHLIYRFRQGMWAALDANYYAGGRTTTDGVRGNDLQQNSRLGLTVALPVNRHNSVKLSAGTGVSTRTGSDFDSVGVFWQYRWGGGL
jgi:Putative MetA-pathway of phenol degradation